MSRPKPGAESTMRRGFPDAVQKKILIIYGAIFGVGVLYAFLIRIRRFGSRACFGRSRGCSVRDAAHRGWRWP